VNRPSRVVQDKQSQATMPKNSKSSTTISAIASLLARPIGLFKVLAMVVKPTMFDNYYNAASPGGEKMYRGKYVSTTLMS